jgi:hypothetical protein
VSRLLRQYPQYPQLPTELRGNEGLIASYVDTLLPNPSGLTRPCSFVSLDQKLLPDTKKYFWGVKRWLMHKADNLTAICEPIA